MAERWYVTKDGRSRLGPYSWQTLCAMALDGSLLPADMLLREGGHKWMRADAAPGLFDDFAPAQARDSIEDERRWAFILHLSVFAGFVIPFAGLLAPLAIWQLKRADLPGLDAHGKNLANWIFSKLIYLAGGFVSAIILILTTEALGFHFAAMLVVLLAYLVFLGFIVWALVVPIVAAIKANHGEVWLYPLAIPFFR